MCCVAAARVSLAPAPPRLPPSDEVTKRGAFVDISVHTVEMRRAAAKDFPTDLWSQDDSFHEQERRRARDYAAVHRISIQDALDGIDQGLRTSAARGGDVTAATVPPCRPRPIY